MKYLLIFFFLIQTAVADVFKISGNLFEFKNQAGLFVKGCENKCEALRVVSQHQKIDLKKARKKQNFRGSIGSDVCALIYQAKSIIGVNLDQDQRAFCVFPDDSMIEINSLSDYLISKKIVSE